MWDTAYTIPTFVLLLIIAAAFVSRKRLPVRANNLFSKLLFIDIVTMMADYSSAGMVEWSRLFPDPLIWVMNYLFFSLFALRSYFFFLFAIALLNDRGKKYNRKLDGGLFAAEQIFIFIGSVNGWLFSVQNGVCANGILSSFLYVQALLWAVLAMLLVIKMEEPLFVHKTAVYVYILIQITGALIGLSAGLPEVMNLFCLFAIQVVYLIYMNPSQYIDSITGLFTHRGWDLVLNEAACHSDFSLIGFGIRGYAGFRQIRGEKKKNQSLKQIADWLIDTFPDLSLFYQGGGVFLIASDHPYDQNAVLNTIDRRFERSWQSENGDFYLHVNKLVMRSGTHRVNNDIFRQTIFDALQSLTTAEHLPLVEINEKAVADNERKADIHTTLIHALNTDGLEMFLQPIVNVHTGEAEGAEALCRLPDGKGGYVYPDAFIPLALNNGNMDVLGHQMFQKACAFMNRKDVRHSQLKWVNVNLSPDQFQNPNLLSDLMTMVSEYHLDPSCIHLEITEETMVDRTLLHSSIAAFCEKGFKFSMDDFGSSYSNMIRLQQNHFSAVKIDKDFTWGYFNEKTPLLPDIIKTCHDLGTQVVIEGIETKEMADDIVVMQADFIQGYYYSRPICESKFIQKFIHKS